MYSMVGLLVLVCYRLFATIIADFFFPCNTVDFPCDAADLVHKGFGGALTGTAQTKRQGFGIKLPDRIKSRQIQALRIHTAPQRRHIQAALGDEL
ncbi:MAG: hypothetical protein SPH66_00990 [Gemmiger sp.]|uniref:hypothetical protein n=1 Tax=Gemmiger sp. TaxID=2049027 RepID=UPI002A91DED4|nr:hypothetical protein [Gemmiger sp.]MDY5202539.1 hypothetical protein [Gemmiger sp.]